MLVDMALVGMVQMPVMQVVDMSAMPHRSVPTTGLVHVVMVGMVGLRTVSHHPISS